VLECKPAELALDAGNVRGRRGKPLSYGGVITEFFGSKAGEIIGRGIYRDLKTKKAALGATTTFWEVGWGGAEVEVDRDTGAIAVKKYVSIADVGRAIHPIQCEGQDEGGVMFGLGHTLFEQMVYEDGQLLNPNLVDYRVPTFEDLPQEFSSSLIENENGPGPFGAKGMGEGGLLPVASAIANAIARACGVRFYELPITPEKVWRALGAKRSAKT
jgi:CO/xanthine dehydrogenase Mo-binding subunit